MVGKVPRIKITSGGTAHTTRVVDLDTGVDFSDEILDIELEIKDRIWYAKLTVMPQLDIDSDHVTTEEVDVR